MDDDGSFWMAWDDFCEEFEQLTVCHLDDPNDMEKRCIGTFSYNGKYLSGLPGPYPDLDQSQTELHLFAIFQLRN